MKEFFRERIGGLLVFTAVLLFAFVSVSVYAFCDFMVDARRERYYDGLCESEMKSAVYSLRDTLASGDRIGAYHKAEEASAWAFRGGMDEEANFFANLAEGVREMKNAADRSVLADKIEAFLENGTVDFIESDLLDVGGGQLKYTPPSADRVKAGMDTAQRAIGVNGGLRLIENTRSDDLIFSCRNAYAVIECRSGRLKDVFVSFERTNAEIDEGDCIASAREFLNEFYPIYEGEKYEPIEIFERNGDVCFEFVSGERKILLEVDRGRGRVVGAVAIG